MKNNHFGFILRVMGSATVALSTLSYLGLRHTSTGDAESAHAVRVSATTPSQSPKTLTSEEWRTLRKRVRAKMPRMNAAQKARVKSQYPTVVVKGVSAKARKNPYIRVAESHADYFYLSSDNMVNYSDVVIVATPIQSFLDRTRGAVYARGTTDLLDFWVSTDVTIQQVLKQPAGTPLQVGQVMRIVEPLGLLDENGELTKLLSDDCYELQQGSRYLLFLGDRDSYGERPNVNLNFGRYNLDATDPNEDVNAVDYANGQSPKRIMRDGLLTRFNLQAAEPLPAPYNCRVSIRLPTEPGRRGIYYCMIFTLQRPDGKTVVERRIDDGEWQFWRDDLSHADYETPATQATTSVIDRTVYPSGTVCAYRSRVIKGVLTSYYSPPVQVTVP